MTIGERIKNRRIKLGLNVDDIADALNKNRATIYRYESNEIEKLPTTVLEPLAEILKVSPAYLMGWETENHLDISNVYIPEFKSVPLLGRIACGEPILAVENIIDHVRVENNVNCDFALLCKGDSMINARIFDGDIVYIRKQEDVENGEIAAVLIDNEATLKRVYKYDNRLELRAENPVFPAINVEGKELETVRIIGKAVAFTSYVK